MPSKPMTFGLVSNENKKPKLFPYIVETYDLHRSYAFGLDVIKAESETDLRRRLIQKYGPTYLAFKVLSKGSSKGGMYLLHGWVIIDGNAKHRYVWEEPNGTRYNIDPKTGRLM